MIYASSLLLLSVASLFGCKDDGSPVDTGLIEVDADGDGVLADDDCDDVDANNFPGNEEVCDGADNDCDGVADNDAVDASDWYADADGDSYGAGDPTSACDPPQGAVDNAEDCDDTDATVNPDAEEVCDGIDNDCDGTIDGPDSVDAETWYADTDGDGFGDPGAPVVDCPGEGLVSDDTDCDDTDAATNPAGTETWYDDVDADCDGEDDPDICEGVPEGEWFDDDPACTYTPMGPDAWEVEVEWSTDPASGWTWSAGSNNTHVMMTPVVGQLTDDNGDGVIDEYDTPDIAFNTFWGSGWASYGYLRVVSGDGTGEHYSLGSVSDGSTDYLIHGTAGMAIGDIEGDGSPDLLTMTYRGRLLALEADGTFKWVSSIDGLGQYSYPTITDMDGDGLAEIIVGTEILDSNGDSLASASTGSTWGAFAADLDGDGALEHIGGTSVTDIDGNTLWEDTTTSAGIPAVMDWDGDGDGDVLNSSGGTLTVYDESGVVLMSTSVSGSPGGSPCVGDLDGDGDPEVAIAGTTAVTAIETDGTTMWTVSASDPSSGGTPCTTWDFDGDGDFEVLVSDEQQFRILDGSDGTALLTESSYGSGTLQEQPVPVDVDRDGATEIVLAANDYYWSGWDGIYVLGEANDEWTTTRTTWNQGPFWSGNVNDDMSIPTLMDMPWDLDNSFRSQLSPTADPLATQDFQVEILGVCEECEAGSVEVYVSPLNAGAVWGPAGVDVALYADDGSTRTLLEVQQTDAALNAGERLEPMTFVVPMGGFPGGDLVAVIDDDGAGGGSHNECDEENNEGWWVDPFCE